MGARSRLHCLTPSISRRCSRRDSPDSRTRISSSTPEGGVASDPRGSSRQRENGRSGNALGQIDAPGANHTVRRQGAEGSGRGGAHPIAHPIARPGARGEPPPRLFTVTHQTGDTKPAWCGWARETLLRRFAEAAYFPEMNGRFSFLIALAALTTSYGSLLSSGLTRCAAGAPPSWWS